MTTSNFSAPTLIDGYATMGIDSLNTLIGFNRVPPDHNGAVGPGHVVSVFNHALQVFDKDGNHQSTQTLDSLFGVLGGTLPVDPNVLYDAANDRYVYVSFEIVGSDATLNPGNDQVFLNVAVSKTNDPAAGWHVTQINAETLIGGVNGWSDFPSIAVDGDNIYITANMFAFDGGGAFLGNRVWIVEKGEGTGGFYDGGSAAASVHDPVGEATDLSGLGVANATFIAARIEGVTGADSGIYLVSADGLTSGVNEVAQVIRIESGPTGPIFTAQSILLGDISVNGALPSASQRGTNLRIASGDGRVWSGGAVERDGKLYFAFDVAPAAGPDAGQVTVHWAALDASNPAALTLLQQGNIGGEDIAPGTHTFMPSIAVNKDGSVLINYSASGPSVYPGAYYALRAADDPAGTFGPAQTLFGGVDYYFRTRSGEGISAQNSNRWGDFSGVSVDPVDGTTFFFFNMFADARGSANAAGQDGRWRLAIGEARPTINDFVFAQGDSAESFFGGLGQDGLTVNAENAGAAVSIAPSGAGVSIAFAGGSAVSAFEVESIRFMGGSGADVVTVAAGFSTIMLARLQFFLSGGAGNDTVTGGAGSDQLGGGAGADSLDGGAGVDTATYADATGGVTIRLWNGTGANNVAAGDVLLGIENVVGSRFVDLLFGADALANRLEGARGNDYLNGLSGNDVLIGGAGADTMDGGAGVDTATYADATGSVTIRLWNGTGANNVAAGDVLSNIETVGGSNYNDNLIGANVTNNWLGGGLGADYLDGLSGNDTLVGGAGADTVTGGAGNDRFEFSAGSGADRVTDFTAGAGVADVLRITGYGAALDSFAEIFAAATQVGADTVINLGGANSITLVGILRTSLAADDFVFG